MNKTAIKNYAVWARNRLIADIEYKAGLMGITEKGIASALPQSTSEVQFFDIGTKDYASVRGDEIRQRNSFVSAIKEKERDVGYAAAFHFVVEKVAYTWFNRLVAIRFMEVNDYLPSRVRVLSSENENKAEPDMVTKPFDTDMDFSQEEQDFIMCLKDENRLDELFRWLFIKQCFKLHEVLPLLFDSEKVSGGRKNEYMELLLTISFTDKDGVLWHLVHDIKERYFRILTEEDLERQKIDNIPDEEMPAGQVEIIGWMYQYYNTEPKDQVFADLKKNIKISKDKIPAATQLFTPDWIVRYMVENSLGRLWVEGHPNDDLKKGWQYYLEEAEQEPEVQAQLAEIRKAYAALRPEGIKAVDPCMGSGHILVYLFDVLMQIYESQGWTRREAAQSIVQNNLYGLDIDERAAQLAYFAVMMKARQYDRRFLERGIEPHVYEIRESNGMTADVLEYFAGGDRKLKKDIETLMSELRDAREYGSILNITQVDFPALYAQFDEIRDDISMYTMPALNDLLPLVKRAEAMAQKYDVVATNPPYMGSSGMGGRLGQFVKDHYPDSKSDMFAVFIERCQKMIKPEGYQAMITQHAWMFLSSFEKLRLKLQTVDTVNMAHLGARAFEEIGGEVVQTTSFVLRSNHISGYAGTYCRLIEPTTQNGKEAMFLAGENRYTARQDNFAKIPGAPVAYWAPNALYTAFFSKTIGEYGWASKGIITGDNARFMRLWHEVSSSKICFLATNVNEAIQSQQKWFPCNKGGDYRKWNGNSAYIIDWYDNGKDIMQRGQVKLRNCQDYKDECKFKPSITWTSISAAKPSFRLSEKAISESAGMTLFIDTDKLLYSLAFLNSNTSEYILTILNPTLNFTAGSISSLPLKIDGENFSTIYTCTNTLVYLSKSDWNVFETSWDFQRHPLVEDAMERGYMRLSDCWEEWARACDERFAQLKANEEELNRIFIDIYSLQDVLAPEVQDKDVTVRRADLQRDIRSLISYAVGCMFGRYSLDVDGLAYAGGEWDAGKYSSFIPDADNCIPITDEPYFEDDIVGRFVEFIRIVYGADTLEENLTFIANALGNKGNSSREVIRNYFLNDFFKDHCATYSVTGSGKRPIYWLFHSGKQNGFKALVYMHRWNADTVGNLRVEYLHKMQRVYEKEIERMQDIIENGTNSREISQATKRREKLVKQLKEARDYDAKIAHAALSRVEIDLDDGVKVNYEKVQKGPDGKSLGILAKI